MANKALFFLRRLMRNNTAELIQRILEGDDAAFACLVRKYQKRVHALAWRKIGDFHIAEDITQETFLQVYRRLAKLKDPSQFPGWLYVIANRRCLAWLRKKRVQTQSLEKNRITNSTSVNFSMRSPSGMTHTVGDLLWKTAQHSSQKQNMGVPKVQPIWIHCRQSTKNLVAAYFKKMEMNSFKVRNAAWFRSLTRKMYSILIRPPIYSSEQRPPK